MNEYYTFAFNDDDDFEVMVTITSIVQKTTNNITSLSNNTTTTHGNNDNTQLLNDTYTVDKNVVSSLLSIRTKQTTNNDNQSTNDNNNNIKEFHVKAGSGINNVSANETLPIILEARDFENSEDDSKDDAYLPTDEFQDFEDRTIHQMFSPPVHHETNDDKEPWSEDASLKKGLRGTATINPTSNDTQIQSTQRKNFEVFRNDDSSTTAPQQINTRLSTKVKDSLQFYTTRPLSIMNVSNTAHSTITKLFSLPHLSPSQDSVQEFPPLQELHVVNTPTASSKTKNTIVTLDDDVKDYPSLTQLNDVISFVSSNNSDETYNDDDLSYDSFIDSMPQLLQRTKHHSDRSSSGYDDSSDNSLSYYIQDNNDNISEWLDNNDDEVVVKRSHSSSSLKADDTSIVSNYNNNDVARSKSSIMTNTSTLVSLLSTTNTNIDTNDVPTPHISPAVSLQSTHTLKRIKTVDDNENYNNAITTKNDAKRTNSSIMTTTTNLVSILSNRNENVATNFVPTTRVLPGVIIPTLTMNTLKRNKTVDDHNTLLNSTTDESTRPQTNMDFYRSQDTRGRGRSSSLSNKQSSSKFITSKSIIDISSTNIYIANNKLR